MRFERALRQDAARIAQGIPRRVRLSTNRMLVLSTHGDHGMAGLGACAAHLGAFTHHAIARIEALAVVTAQLADACTCPAHQHMVGRTTVQKILRGLAYLRAIQQQSDVRGRGMLAALAQTVRNHLQARVVAFMAEVRAFAHFVGYGDVRAMHLVRSFREKRGNGGAMRVRAIAPPR